MKSAYQSHRGAAVVVCCLLGACHIATNDETANGGEGGNGDAPATAAAGSEALGSDTAAGGKHAGGLPGVVPPSADSGAAGQAGAGNEAGASGAADLSDGGAGPLSAPLDPATAECDADGGCLSKCVNESVSCAVESFALVCEFELFHDMPAAMTCGQTVTVGTASCGGCGPIAIKLYYDGSHCWQGIPDCAFTQFSGKFLDPHAPLASP